MRSELDHCAIWDIVSRMLQHNGSLEDRANGGVRIRWRCSEKDSPRCQHSFDAPPEIADTVRTIAQRYLRMRELRRQIGQVTDQAQKELDEKIKAQRKKIWNNAPGGRTSKRKAVELFESLLDSRRGLAFEVYHALDIWSIRVTQPGRPPSTPPKALHIGDAPLQAVRRNEKNLSWKMKSELAQRQALRMRLLHDAEEAEHAAKKATENTADVEESGSGVCGAGDGGGVVG